MSLTQNEIGIKYLGIGAIQGKMFYKYVKSRMLGKHKKKAEGLLMFMQEVNIIKKYFWLAYHDPNLYDHDKLIRYEKRVQQLYSLS